MTDTQLSNPCLSHDSRWLPRTLFWKEFRQLGPRDVQEEHACGLLIMRNLCIFLDAFILPVDVAVLSEFNQTRVAAGRRLGRVLRQMGGQRFLERCMLGLVGEVRVFMRVGQHVVEFFGTVGVTDVAVGFGADRVVSGAV